MYFCAHGPRGLYVVAQKRSSTLRIFIDICGLCAGLKSEAGSVERHHGGHPPSPQPKEWIFFFELHSLLFVVSWVGLPFSQLTGASVAPFIGRFQTKRDSNTQHTRAKSRDHEILRAQKKVCKGRLKTPPTSCHGVTDSSSAMWSHMWSGPQPIAISTNFYSCGSSHMIN